MITKAFPEYLEALSDPTQSNKVEAMALAMLAGWQVRHQKTQAVPFTAGTRPTGAKTWRAGVGSKCSLWWAP